MRSIFHIPKTFVLTILACVLGLSAVAQSSLVHFWVFDGSMPNNTPLTQIESSYSVAGDALITYHSALEGYPFEPGHPNWRKASLERRNAPTPLNYRPEGNGGVSFENSDMRGAQVKQPFTGDAGENTLYFHLPTTGFENILLSFAAMDEGAAENLLIDYSIDPSGNNWITDGLAQTSFNLAIFYQLYQIDFSDIAATANNADFMVRMRFQGSDMGADDGDRVTFNNIALDGDVLSGMNFPPVVVAPIGFQATIEESESFSFDLNEVFSDPENDPLTFAAVSSNPGLVSATISGSTLNITPVKRGDSEITISASDGNNPAVESSFRVLVYPKPLDLSTFYEPLEEFTFGYWNPNEPEHSYPEHMLFLQSDKSDPALNDPLLFAYYIPHDDYHGDDAGTIGFPYNNTRRTRINGLGEDGISFINTGRNRDVGGMLLAIGMPDTKSPSWEIKWTAGTIAANERTYALRLMYRYGIEGEFMDFYGEPHVYVSSEDGHTEEFTIYPMFGDLLAPYVQLLWKYYHVDGDSGPRAEIRLDDISIRALVNLDEKPSVKPRIHAEGKNIVLDTRDVQDVDLQIYNLSGQLVFSNSFKLNQKAVLQTGLNKGMYIVRLNTATGSHTTKIVLD